MAGKMGANDSAPDVPDPALCVWFDVTIDGKPIGKFTSCEGLGLEVVMETREEGGNNTMVWQLPTRLKYTNIKLSRPIGPDTITLTNWIVSAVQNFEPTTAVIIAQSGYNTNVAKWSLDQVVPVRWTGPNLNLDTPKVATETLELAHHGFKAEKG